MNKLSSQIIEKIAMKDLHQAATEEQRRILGLRCFELGQGLQAPLVSLASKLPEPAIVINMTFDLTGGLSSESTEDELIHRVQATVDSYREQGVNRYFIQFVDRDNSSNLEQALASQGLQPARGWQEFERDASFFKEPLPALSKDSEIRLIDETDADEFGRIACAGFDFVVPGQDPQLVAVTESWLSQIVGRPNWYVFMAFVEGQAAGVGVLYVHENYGWLSFGSTSPRFRGRGLQSALLRARVEQGIQLGCKRFYTCTGVAVPGDPQHSYNNILKTGFQPSYVMANYQPKR